MIKTKSLIKQLNKASENLSVENEKIFDDIVVYVRTSNIKTRDAEEFLQQILDSFLNAEQQGVSIENVLGTTDIKHYCDEIVDTYKSSYNYSYIKKSCFKETAQVSTIKEFFKLWILSCLWICILIACLMFLDEILVFRLNIIVVLIVGIALYFIGTYVSEK